MPEPVVDRERLSIGFFRAGASPLPWALGSPADLETATSPPGTAYKLESACVLARRALEAVR